MEAANLGPPADDRAHIERFVGSWGLVSFEHVLPSSETSRPLGDVPLGLLLYQADGYMSAQISAANPARLASEDPLEATPEEIAEAWRSYFGYWGSFKVSPEERIVVHSVEGSSFSNWIGTEQVRRFRFDGANRLILEADSSSGHLRATWERRLRCNGG